ncbi:MAG: aldolase/citrate lyase family protein [Verrucomicrobia bacterium]|nr:aldolase/citrate lyase family protein [Verrucomicrobiota bacterium]
MKSRPSRLLAKLRQGGIPTIAKINLSDPRVIEIAGLCGADAVWLCNEHVPNDWIGLENQIRAARIHNVDTFVRVGRGSYSDYIRPLEADATGIIVPHVASADEARQVVDWVRCHPVGKRPLDGGNTDGQFCLLPMEEYIRQANTERIVVLQIESPEALEQVDAIAAVPGFDMLLFGPGDFSHRIGHAGQLDHPVVVAARKRVAASARAHGKFAMTAGLIAPFNDLVAEGYQAFNVGADVVGLGAYFKQRLDLLANHIQALPPAGQFQPKSSPYA